jgi:hypothetical protein
MEAAKELMIQYKPWQSNPPDCCHPRKARTAPLSSALPLKEPGDHADKGSEWHSSVPIWEEW